MFAYQHISPTEHDADLARESSKLLRLYTQEEQSLVIRVDEQKIELPASAVTLLKNILEVMETGQTVTVLAEDSELTTVQAAKILSVSRPFLIKLLENGALPYRMVGTHRRIRMEDVMAYKKETDRQREQVLDELVAQAQALDMGY